MRNALFLFGAMVLAVLVGLTLFHRATDKVTPLDRATTDLDRSSLLLRQDFEKATGSMRASISEFYMSSGRMPHDNAEAALPSPEQFRGQTLKSATVDPVGAIELVFDANSGKDNGRVRLVADLTHAEAMGVQWRCETRDYPQISHALPACEYRAQ